MGASNAAGSKQEIPPSGWFFFIYEVRLCAATTYMRSSKSCRAAAWSWALRPSLIKNVQIFVERARIFLLK